MWVARNDLFTNVFVDLHAYVSQELEGVDGEQPTAVGGFSDAGEYGGLVSVQRFDGIDFHPDLGTGAARIVDFDGEQPVCGRSSPFDRVIIGRQWCSVVGRGEEERPMWIGQQLFGGVVAEFDRERARSIGFGVCDRGVAAWRQRLHGDATELAATRSGYHVAGDKQWLGRD
ncbi:hypothetical protein [Mycolicibacterium llatzerense]|uniref:hypothetical protein n=1 Tax=Mycolicibacterium llatzerense TaxID=280871 RepID=UPI0013A6D8CC|nr:hypothetical protein [Mycolicibacterium llatzerense]